eukprot:scaffold49619_cov17-Tisochrysis_lutea.AAC.3
MSASSGKADAALTPCRPVFTAGQEGLPYWLSQDRRLGAACVSGGSLLTPSIRAHSTQDIVEDVVWTLGSYLLDAFTGLSPQGGCPDHALGPCKMEGEDPIMPTVTDPNGQVNTDAYSASQFFSRMCAPRCGLRAWLEESYLCAAWLQPACPDCPHWNA